MKKNEGGFWRPLHESYCPLDASYRSNYSLDLSYIFELRIDGKKSFDFYT